MIEVTCPSGLQGRIRGMKVKDEQLFINRKLGVSGRVIAELLRSVWQETTDPGPYNFPEGVVDWDQVLSSDRTYILIQLRIASYGADYEFRVTCGSCRKMFGWGVNLDDDIDVVPVSEQGLHAVKTGEPISVTLHDGRVAKCRLMRGEDDSFLATLGTKDEAKIMTYHLARRIVELDGRHRFKEIVALVEDMEAIVGDRLWDATDELEGGVETMFDVECPTCGNVQQVLLPFGAEFFSSRKRYVRSKTRKAG
jgi:hypothetical protein